jgi:hypothetical protein
MVQLRRIRPLASNEIGHLTVQRLLEYRKQALSLENTLAESDYIDTGHTLDHGYIWFKDDPRWRPLYDAILVELARKQKSNDGE